MLTARPSAQLAWPQSQLKHLPHPSCYILMWDVSCSPCLSQSSCMPLPLALGEHHLVQLKSMLELKGDTKQRQRSLGPLTSKNTIEERGAFDL